MNYHKQIKYKKTHLQCGGDTKVDNEISASRQTHVRHIRNPATLERDKIPVDSNSKF